MVNPLSHQEFSCTTAAPSAPPTSPTSSSARWWPACSVQIPHETTVLDSVAEEFPYDLPAITTAGRYWVSGTAEVGGAPKPFRMFVKHVQSWARHPFFAMVPPEQREWAAATVPWRTEALAYRSDLGERLPHGLSHAARARRLRPRRGVQRGLAGGDPRRRSRVGPDALHPGSQAARPARHQCARDGAARQRRAHHDDPDLPRRTPVDGRPADDPRRQRLAAPARRRRVRRRPSRPAPRGGRSFRGVRRGAGRQADRGLARRCLSQQPARAGGLATTSC